MDILLINCILSIFSGYDEMEKLFASEGVVIALGQCVEGFAKQIDCRGTFVRIYERCAHVVPGRLVYAIIIIDLVLVPELVFQFAAQDTRNNETEIRINLNVFIPPKG